MKSVKEKSVQVDLKVWCATCCIRIAPNEESALHDGKAYHVNCQPRADEPAVVAAGATKK